ncbi:glycosyltransferase [Maribacter sp. 6B07]|uniref:glycosyltransferase n=1 Tax=Maribacter sp. 6B07 TaxID=2045442 RepID=UPI00117E1384|nr:glycosyltransferase [Maribacter sp. 6B07]
MKLRVVFLLPSLGGGGSERVFMNLCKYFNKDKFEVTLCLLKKEGEFLPQIEEDPTISIHDLKVSRVRYSIYPIIKFIRKEQPDIVLSTLGHLNAMLSAVSFLIPRNVKVIGRESNIVSKSNHNRISILFYKMFYKNFDKIIVQSDDMEIDLKNLVRNLKENQVVKINNPVDLKHIQSLKHSTSILLPQDKINLISVGSLTYQKGYDLLFKSFAKFEDKEKYHISIIGKGKLKNELIELLKILNIEKHVSLLGFQDNPYKYISQSSIFISSSRFEGFPNVVLESLICDVPVIANNYKGGINEIINKPIFGQIIDIENSELLERTCNKILSKDHSKDKISEEVNQRYGITSIVSRYEDLILNM